MLARRPVDHGQPPPEIKDLPARLGVPLTTIKNVLPLATLGPRVLRAALGVEGSRTLPPRVSIKRLLRVARQLDWSRQEEMLWPKTG